MSEIDTEQYTLDTLDELHAPVCIAGMTFDASAVVREMDPIAFRQIELDTIDAHVQDGDWFEWADGTIHDESEDDEDDLTRVPCAECEELADADDLYKGLCPSCVHNARRSGWEG